MPIFIPVLIEDVAAADDLSGPGRGAYGDGLASLGLKERGPYFPGFRYAGVREPGAEHFPEPHDAFEPLATVRELPQGNLPEGFLPEGVEDPRPLMADEPDVLFFVEDDAMGGGGYFAGFDRLPEPIEIPFHRFRIGIEGEGVGKVVWASTIWAENTDDVGRLEGLGALEWAEIVRLRVGQCVVLGGGAAVAVTVKRIADAASPLIDPEARYSYPDSRSPEEEYTLSELWHGRRTSDDRLGWDADDWSAVLALQPGETYEVPGNEYVSGGRLLRTR